MVRVDRHDCPTVQANDARDLVRSGRVALVAVETVRGDAPLWRVELDDEPLGLVLLTDDGWLAARPGWSDSTPRSKRHAAVRRLIMSHPRSIIGQ